MYKISLKLHGHNMRVHSIDYLRGIMAFSVVLYHFFRISDSSTILGRLGIYSVSTFYIISGMALFLSHKNEKWDVKNYLIFIFRRFIRLAPVYWLAMIFLFLFYSISSHKITYDTIKIVQNILLTFGITDPLGYMIIGGWSIGNEIVFYLFFPLIIASMFRKQTMIIMAFLTIILFLYCSFYYMNNSETLYKQWGDYINPINQVYFFIFGVILSKILLPYVGRAKRVSLLIIFVASLVFCLYPASGDQIHIVTNFEKIVFTLVVIFLSAAFFSLGDLKNTPVVHIPLKFLGDVSYSLYLLHGVALMFFGGFISHCKILHSLGDFTLLVFMPPLLFAAWICHVYIERPIIVFGKNIMKNKEQILQ